MGEHTPTPTPWRVGSTRGDGLETLIEADYGFVGECDMSVEDARNAANAAFIARAVNSHEALVEALHDAEYALTNIAREAGLGGGPCEAEELCGASVCNNCGCICDKRDNARAALALAAAIRPVTPKETAK